MELSKTLEIELYRGIGIADRVRALGCPSNIPMDVFIVTQLCDPLLALLPVPKSRLVFGEIYRRAYRPNH